MSKKVLLLILVIFVFLNVILLTFVFQDNNKIAVQSQIPSLNVKITDYKTLLSQAVNLEIFKDNNVTVFKRTYPLRTKVTVKKVKILVSDKPQDLGKYIKVVGSKFITIQSYGLTFIPSTSTLEITIQIDPTSRDVQLISKNISLMVRSAFWDITQTQDFPGNFKEDTLKKRTAFMQAHNKNNYFLVIENK